MTFRFVLDIFVQTIRTLWSHKLRSFLTMFGIAWGVSSLLLLIGLGEGFRSGNRKQLSRFGEDVMVIWGIRSYVAQGPNRTMKWNYLTYDDYAVIRDEAKLVRGVTATIGRGNLRAISVYANSSGSVNGVMPNFNRIRATPLDKGRWFNDFDDEQRRHVAIMGVDIAGTLFPNSDPLNQDFILQGHHFQVIGILTNDSREGNQDMRIYIPFQTMDMLFPLNWADAKGIVSNINYQPRTREEHLIAKDEVHKIIDRHRGFPADQPGNYEEWDTIQSAETIGKIFDAMNMFLGSVGLVTLALGAIGIINIMLVSVAERTPEIGLRKALGATNRQVLSQFFFEGAFLALLSGGVGLAFAAGLVSALARLPAPPGFDTPRIVSSSATLAIGGLALAAVVAGFVPARRAALLTPVEALRQE